MRSNEIVVTEENVELLRSEGWRLGRDGKERNQKSQQDRERSTTRDKMMETDTVVLAQELCDQEVAELFAALLDFSAKPQWL